MTSTTVLSSNLGYVLVGRDRCGVRHLPVVRPRAHDQVRNGSNDVRNFPARRFKLETGQVSFSGSSKVFL